MKLQPKQTSPDPEYPTYKNHQLNRRAVIGGSATLLLATGCKTREPFRPEPLAPPRMPGLLKPAPTQPKPEPERTTLRALGRAPSPRTTSPKKTEAATVDSI